MRGSCAQYLEKDVVFKTKKRPSKGTTKSQLYSDDLCIPASRGSTEFPATQD